MTNDTAKIDIEAIERKARRMRAEYLAGLFGRKR
jgi:hypothetical protein